jgi:hypothetical protein
LQEVGGGEGCAFAEGDRFGDEKFREKLKKRREKIRKKITQRRRVRRVSAEKTEIRKTKYEIR